ASTESPRGNAGAFVLGMDLGSHGSASGGADCGSDQDHLRLHRTLAGPGFMAGGLSTFEMNSRGREAMLIGKNGNKPVLIYIALGIVILSLALTFFWSRQVRTASPPVTPPHQDR